MTQRHFVDLTIRSYDDMNGRIIQVHPDDIRQLIPNIKFYKEPIPKIGETPELCTMVRFNAGFQTVVESAAQIEDQINAIKNDGEIVVKAESETNTQGPQLLLEGKSNRRKSRPQ
jgi:hypothetical protein